MAASSNDLPSSVPLPRTRLIGREQERATARAFLVDEAVPLLTLTGPGGVGKTRLALAIAQDLAAQFADGVAWVDLAPLTDAALVPAAMVAALAITPAPGHPILAEFTRHLRPRQTLLLLDNCEHVLAATADLVSTLLAACPAVQVLATSRTRLQIRGEQILPIDPLPLPDIDAPLDGIVESEAVRLFAARARAVRPGFHVDTANAAAVALLCRHLDGLPLALELAAAHSAVLSPATLLAQMTDRLRLLAGGARDLPARQQTMREAIAWSYDQLSAEEQIAFRQLAIFTGGWTLEAATAVLELDEETTLALLERLVIQSLVVRPVSRDAVPDRFTMLETIRAFGLEQLAEPDAMAAVRERHATWCLAAARASEPDLAVGRNQVWWLARLDAEFPNLRAALAWWQESGNALGVVHLLVALDEFWTSRAAHYPELRDWVQAILSTEPDVSGEELAVLLHLAVETTVAACDPGEALSFAQQALAVAQSLSDPFVLGRAYHNLALAWNASGDQPQAEAAHAAALPQFRKARRDIWVALTLSHLGTARLVAGDIAVATLLLDEALGLERQLAYPWGIATVAEKRARAALTQGDTVLATRLLSESIAAAQDIGNEWIQLRAMTGLVSVALACDQPERAARLLGAIDAARTKQGFRHSAHDTVFQPIEAAVRAAIGESAFATAAAAGRALSLDQALIEALAMPTSTGLPAAPVRTAVPLPDQAPGFDLTPREHDVLALLCRRLTNAEIAEVLFLSPRTIESHVAHVIDKLGAANRRDAAALAVRYELIETELFAT